MLEVIASALGIGWLVGVFYVVLRAMWQNVRSEPRPEPRGFEVGPPRM